MGQNPRAVFVVGGRIGLGGEFVLSNVRPDDGGAPRRRGAQLAQLLRGRVRARVVEAHSIAQSPFLHETPQARRFVARLRAWRHGADFDEGVAQGAHAQDGFGILVHSRG